MAAESIEHDPRVYMAAERTFLAWIRTSLALMAFGFVIARFGLFLREIEATNTGAAAAPTAFSLPIGVIFVLIGVITNIAASLNHVRSIRELNEGKPMVGRPSRLAIALALILAIAGFGMAVYLGATSGHKQATGNASSARPKSNYNEAAEVALAASPCAKMWSGTLRSSRTIRNQERTFKM
jgi:putative membrane protein